MRKTSCYFIFYVLLISQAIAQNVGIGTESPLNRLHVLGSSSTVLRLQSTSAIGAEIVFQTAAGTQGYMGAYDGTFNMYSFGTVPIILGTNNTDRVVIAGSTGNIGIGNSLTPPERLTISSGNLLLSSSAKGIMLNAADRPFITRGFDEFTSGNYDGLGRWGMFMEPSRLVLGIPFVSGKAVEISKYLVSSARTTLLTIHSEAGEMRRPGTGNVDLLPICIGSVAVNGGIKGGSGNFSVSKDIASGLTEITVSGISYNANEYAVIATCYADNGVRAYPVIVADNGKIRVWQYNQDGTVSNQAFSFMVYRF